MKHALSEQVKLCPTIHASLEQFEPGDLPFRLTAHTCPSLTTQSKSEDPQRLLQSERALGMGKVEERKPLSEDFAPTSHFGTKEAADFHTQMKRSFATGKVV